jgi:hypothetical protein
VTLSLNYPAYMGAASTSGIDDSRRRRGTQMQPKYAGMCCGIILRQTTQRYLPVAWNKVPRLPHWSRPVMHGTAITRCYKFNGMHQFCCLLVDTLNRDRPVTVLERPQITAFQRASSCVREKSSSS